MEVTRDGEVPLPRYGLIWVTALGQLLSHAYQYEIHLEDAAPCTGSGTMTATLATMANRANRAAITWLSVFPVCTHVATRGFQKGTGEEGNTLVRAGSQCPQGGVLRRIAGTKGSPPPGP